MRARFFKTEVARADWREFWRLMGFVIFMLVVIHAIATVNILVLVHLAPYFNVFFRMVLGKVVGL